MTFKLDSILFPILSSIYVFNFTIGKFVKFIEEFQRENTTVFIAFYFCLTEFTVFVMLCCSAFNHIQIKLNYNVTTATTQCSS